MPLSSSSADTRSHPAACTVGPIAAVREASPSPACEGDTITFSYTPNEGPLAGQNPYLGILGEGVFPMADNGGTWTYVPTPDADGFDAAVTDIRFTPTAGPMNASGGGGDPYFELTIHAQIQ